MIEVYLKENNNNVLRFPVTPEEVGLELSSEISTEKINGLGEVSLFSGKNLKNTNISGFFPNQKYSFCNYTGFKKPYEYVKMVEKWLNEGTKLRYIVTSSNANIQVMISSFNYSEKDGTGDVYFDISLIECIDIKINKTTSSSENSNSNNTNNTTNRTNENNPSNEAKTHTVVKGDTLWAIAKKYYGDGSKYPQIKEKNKAKYTSLSKNNIIYTGWVLEL